jgi:hypothetical protein
MAELAWISEYKELQLQKLTRKYFEDVAVERIVVRCFKSPHSVSTFPVKFLSRSLQAKIKLVHQNMKKEQEVLIRQQAEKILLAKRRNEADDSKKPTSKNKDSRDSDKNKVTILLSITS